MSCRDLALQVGRLHHPRQQVQQIFPIFGDTRIRTWSRMRWPPFPKRFSRSRDRDGHHAGKLEYAALKPAQAYRAQSLQAARRVSFFWPNRILCFTERKPCVVCKSQLVLPPRAPPLPGIADDWQKFDCSLSLCSRDERRSILRRPICKRNCSLSVSTSGYGWANRFCRTICGNALRKSLRRPSGARPDAWKT
jgi:hypothetical protein